MIDNFFHQLAKEIVTRIPKEGIDFLSDMLSNNVFQTMTEEELQIACIKIALEALTLAAVMMISRHIHKNKTKKKTPTNQPAGKPFKPKKWNPDGYYFDEDKNQWIDPDYR